MKSWMNIRPLIAKGRMDDQVLAFLTPSLVVGSQGRNLFQQLIKLSGKWQLILPTC